MELINTAVQTVQPSANVVYNNIVTGGNSCSLIYRMGSGMITARGNTQQCRARYRVSFSGNIAVPTGETVGPIQLSLSLNGEALSATDMIVTPAATGDFFNIAASTYVDVPQGCCYEIAVKNTSTIAVDVSSPNLTVERTA